VDDSMKKDFLINKKRSIYKKKRIKITGFFTKLSDCWEKCSWLTDCWWSNLKIWFFIIKLFNIYLPVLNVDTDGVIDDSDAKALFTTGKTVSNDGEIGGIGNNCSVSNSSLLFPRKDGSSSALIIQNQIYYLKKSKTKLVFTMNIFINIEFN
jgi:hypothetical protein